MKSITRTRYGPPEVLNISEIENPIPKDDELLIRVHATTVNRTDCGILWAKPWVIRFFTGLFKPKSPIPGTDFAGEVEAVGSKVTSFKPGDRVWGLNDEGLASHAQYMIIKENKAVVPIPDGFSFAEAVACAEGSHYAYNFITKVKLTPGQKVLVNGATGAIGSAAVQLLKSMNLYVTAVCDTRNVELVRSLGADKVLDYTRTDFTKDDEVYDFVFDAVGKSRFSACKPLLHSKGIYISSELGPNGENIFLALIGPFLRGKKVIFPVPVNTKRSLLKVSELMQQGKFKAVIDRTYPMEEVKEAYKFVVTGQKTGNVILSFE